MNPHRSGKQMACWLGCLPAPPSSIVKETASAQRSASGKLDRGSIHVLGHGADSPSDQPVFSNNPPQHPPTNHQVPPRHGWPQRNFMFPRASIIQLTEQREEITSLPVLRTWSVTKEVDH